MHTFLHLGQEHKLKHKDDPEHEGNSFLRKYQELVNQHRNSKSKPKPNIFKSQRTLSLENIKAFRESSRIKSSIYKSSRPNHFKDTSPRPQHKIKTSSEQSLEISAIHSRRPSTQTLSPNPQKNWASVVSKIQQVEHQSYHNILLNKKLGLNLNSKNQLEAHIEKLKQQILKEKHKKQRAIKNVQKMINKLSKTQEILQRTQKQRKHLSQQIILCSQELDHQIKKHQDLQQIHMRNMKTINQVKRLIQFYEQKNEQTKASLILERYQLNITKDKYFIEKNRLLKNEGKFEQSSNEREKICRSVSKNVRRVAIQKEVAV